MTLTELSYHSRKLLPFLVLFVLIFLIIFYSFKLLFVYLDSNKPKLTVVPSIFGKINSPVVKDATTSAGFKFSLDTIEGKPVTTTDSAKIYSLPKPVTRFGYREKIYLMAKAFGINTEVTRHKLDDNIASFSDSRQELRINIGNFNFTYESQLNSTDSAFLKLANSYIPSKKEIENKAIEFLTNVGRYPDDFAKGTMRVIYLKYNPDFNSYINVENRSEANLVEVDFYRPELDGIPVATPRFFSSSNYVVLLFTQDSFKVVKSQISYYEKSDTLVDLFPVKTGEAAWEELVSGKGIVVSARAGLKNIVIKDMKIYYLDPDNFQPFLQPVYVFYDDKDFVAFIPAVSNEYLIE